MGKAFPRDPRDLLSIRVNTELEGLSGGIKATLYVSITLEFFTSLKTIPIYALEVQNVDSNSLVG